MAATEAGDHRRKCPEPFHPRLTQVVLGASRRPELELSEPKAEALSHEGGEPPSGLRRGLIPLAVGWHETALKRPGVNGPLAITLAPVSATGPEPR